jgi:hypothetical protein
MSKNPIAGNRATLDGHKVTIYKVTSTHVTVTMSDGKMWCMLLKDFIEKSEQG